MILTEARLREVLRYDPETGIFTWLVNRGPIKVGDRAGVVHSTLGYVFMCIDYHRYLAHRLAWFYVHGVWPPEQIDHINMKRADNRLCNLRLASHSENKWNAGKRSHNTTGLKGVCRDKRLRFKWYAEVRANKKRVRLGSFNCPAAAYLSYIVAADKLHKEFARIA